VNINLTVGVDRFGLVNVITVIATNEKSNLTITY